jgi:phosphatidylglycerophosphate synthase
LIAIDDKETAVVTLATWANALSALRALIALPCAYSIWTGAWTTAGVLFAVAVVTDVSDGIVARRRGEASALGGLLDHSIDAAFVTVNLAALAVIGIVTPLLAPLAITSFAQYVWDSKALSGAPLRASVLGRWNGIGYYVIVGVPTLQHALGVPWPTSALIAFAAWLMVVSTVISMGDRAYALWRIRRG